MAAPLAPWQVFLVNFFLPWDSTETVWERSGVRPLAFAGPQDEGTAVFEMGAKVLGEGPWTC